MKKWFTRLIDPAPNQDGFLKTVLVGTLILQSLAVGGFLLRGGLHTWLVAAELTSLALTGLALNLFSNRAHRLASWLIFLNLFAFITLNIIQLGTIRIPGTSAYLFLVLFSGLLFDKRYVILTSIAASLMVLVLVVAEQTGLLPPADNQVSLFQGVNFIILISGVAYLTYYSIQTNQQTNLQVVREMEETRKHEMERIKSEERFKLFSVAERDVTWLMDVAQNKFVYVSPSVFKLRGYTPEEVISQPIENSLTPESNIIMNKVLQENINNLMQGKRFFNNEPIELEQPRKDGSTVWTEVVANFIMDENNRPVQILGISRDISEKKKASEALLAAQRDLEKRVEMRTAELTASNAALAKAIRARDDFLAAMSHELRTPLTGILGISAALQQQLKDVLNEKQAKGLQSIEKNGLRLNALINDVLDYTRLQANTAEYLQKMPFPLQKTCQLALKAMEKAAAEKDIRLEFSAAPESIQLDADERRIRQVLASLLENALKFTPQGGRVSLAMTGLPEQQLVRISVTDTGIGIDAQDIPRLFQPFIQLDSTTSRKFGGTGLGLAIAHAIVELHEGSIEVQSVPEQGSTFTIQLPWLP